MSEFEVFLSADIEGVSGYTDPSEDADPATAAAMAGDVNAAITGVLDAEPSASVTVADALAETVADRLPAASYVTTKTARGAGAVVCRPPEAVRDDIEAAARAAATDQPPTPTRRCPSSHRYGSPSTS